MPIRVNRHIAWPSVLMIGSLCLLAAFEYFWLRSEYLDEEQLLQEQQTLRLHSAIRELEDSLFQVTAWKPFNVDKDSFECQLPRVHLTHREGKMDSGKFITVLRSVEAGPPDSLRFHKRRPHKGSMIIGALSGQLATSDNDSLHVVVSLPHMLADKLAAMPHEQSDLGFHMISWKEDEQPDSVGLVSKSYFDLSSGTHYAIAYPLFKPYLFRRIVPQMLFAFALFACIAGAFWVISRSLVRQRRLAEMRSNLISNITHELKTPISTVHVALEALQHFNADNDRQRRQEYLSIAQSEVNRLALLVDKVLKTSGLGNGHAQLKIEKFDLQVMIMHVLDTLKVQFGKKSAQVNMDATGEDFIIEADKLQLTGLVHNLVDNALKYGGPNPDIDLNLTQQNGKIILAVTDHGIGIAKEYQDKIFDKFFRVPSGDTHNIKGHGLGLSYVAEVVREHGGTINVQSEPGKGSTFTVTLPRQHAN